MGTTTRAALLRARQRRLELDRGRAERDRRVEETAARVFVLLEQRAQAHRAAGLIDAQLGEALRALASDGLTVRDSAGYCELSTAEVRRLTRLPTSGAGAAPDVPAGPAGTPAGGRPPAPGHVDWASRRPTAAPDDRGSPFG